MTEPLPTQPVALAFTDIQGSSALWEADPKGMRVALRAHDDLLRELIVRWQGYEVKTEGDAFMVAFPEPLAAVRWCLDIQNALLAVPWPESLCHQGHASDVRGNDGRLIFRGLRVRCGVHLTEAEPRMNPASGRFDYYGPGVNFAASVGAAGNGGQVLVSGSTWPLVADRLPNVHVRHLGAYCLKGLTSPQNLVQVLPSALMERTFPPLRSNPASQAELPQSRIVGREADMDALNAAFEGSNRLVTILGPGGMGKTTLARNWTPTVKHRFTGGIWSVDLAPIRTAAELINRLATSMEIRVTTGAADVFAMGEIIGERGTILVIIDNAEMLVADVARVLETWMLLAPEARFLVTSREALDLADEHRLELMALSAAAAVRLFIRRAFDVGVKVQETPALRALVQALDGIPLAIELAAARASMLSPEAMLERLPAQRFQVLRNQRRDADPRHVTLHAAIAWSWNLLTAVEQDALAQCSVFQGGFDLGAAEAILDLSNHPDAPWMLDILAGLHRRSLLTLEDRGSSRYRLYESIRSFAQERLRSAGHEARFVARHSEWYLGWAETMRREGTVEGQAHQLQALSRDKDDFLVIGKRGGPRDVLRTTLALAPLHNVRGPLSEQMELLELSEAVAEGQPRDHLWAELQIARVRTRILAGSYKEAIAIAEEMIPQVEGAGHASLSRWLRVEHGRALRWSGLRAEARTCLEAISREETDPSLAAYVWGELSLVQLQAGDVVQASAASHRAVQLAREAGNQSSEAMGWNSLGCIAAMSSSHGEAIAAFERAAQHYDELGAVTGIAATRHNLGELLLNAGRPGLALAHVAEGIRVARLQGYFVGEVITRALRSMILASIGNDDVAEREARAALGEALGRGNRSTELACRYVLATLLARREHLDEALSELDRARLLAPDFPMMAMGPLIPAWIALVRARMGDLDTARIHLAENPWSLTTWNHALVRVGVIRARLHAIVGDPREASATLREVEQISRRHGYGFFEVQALSDRVRQGWGNADDSERLESLIREASIGLADEDVRGLKALYLG